MVVGSKLCATEPCSSAVLKYPDGAWKGCGVEASPAAPEAAAAALGEGRAAAPGGEVAARLGRTGEPSTAPPRRYTDRGGTEVVPPYPPLPRSARFTYPLAVFSREAVVLAGCSRPWRHREQHFSTAPCPEERKEREREREEEVGGGRGGEEGRGGGGESRASQLTSD